MYSEHSDLIKNLITIIIKTSTPCFFVIKRFIKLNQELSTCCPAVLPSLPWLAAWNLTTGAWILYPRLFRWATQETGTPNLTLWNHMLKIRAWSKAVLCGRCCYWLQTREALKSLFAWLVLERANGNKWITFPRVFVWPAKASELIQRFKPMCDKPVPHVFPLAESSSSRDVAPGSVTSAADWKRAGSKTLQQKWCDKFEEFYSTNACYCFSQNVTKLTIIFTLSAKMWTVYLNILKRIKKTFHKNICCHMKVFQQ